MSPQPPHHQPLLSINCTFGHHEAVGSIDTVFRPGEIVAVTGSNGAGKSTLVDTVAGELEPLDGTVLLTTASGAVDPASPEAAGTLLHLADPSFFPDLTIGEHVSLMAHIAGCPDADLLEEVDAWAVTPLLGSLPSRLSSGQRQRAYLGLQLTQQAPVLTLDEPERHLDAAWTGYLCDRLRDYCDDGACVLVATHSPLISGAADRVVDL
ncbi:ABC transporter ATP-binding protein [Corynebacterium sp. AOP40-9SA-29]|uniref:ABC transporter ATP-binding protein n=1 Tax=Corynebacterium sp. AOP40-9SA-29 TaxID=3457677 RepID=UPI004033DFA8